MDFCLITDLYTKFKSVISVTNMSFYHPNYHNLLKPTSHLNKKDILECFVSLPCLSVCITAGFTVKQMGLPLKLVAMVNSNDIVHRTVTSGDFSMAAHTKQTVAPAIDIQVTNVHSIVLQLFKPVIRGVSLKMTFDVIMTIFIYT